MENLTGKRISKNIIAGEKITDLKEIVRLAQEGKSVVAQYGYNMVQPAAFVA